MKAVRRNNARGFTLLELLLVLAVLVIVVTLTLPTITAPLDNQRLRRAADQVRAKWAQARANAMEHGRTYVFRYEPGTDSYAIEPWINGDDYLESDQLSSLGIDASGQPVDQVTLARAPEKLPENVLFVASETTSDMRAQMLAATSPDQAAAVQATPPIFFYPDGTTSTARLMLTNNRNYFVTLTMRGLTAVVTISDLHSRDEVLP